MICLEKSEFHATILPLNHLREDPMKNIDNISYRFAGYKQYTCWEHNYLEKVVRKVIASSVVQEIRNEYKADNGVYLSFVESKKDEEGCLNSDD